MQIGPQNRAGAGSTNDPRFGDTTATNPAAPLSAITQLKPFVGLATNRPPTGYDDLTDALQASVNTIGNAASATVDQPVLGAGSAFYGSGIQIRINEAVASEDGTGKPIFLPGSFALDAGSQLHSVKLLPASGSAPNAKLFGFSSTGLPPATVLPTLAQCRSINAGSEIGYPLRGTSPTQPVGYILNNSQATAGTGSERVVVYKFGSASLTGPINANTTIVEPPGVPMAFVGTSTTKQWVVTDRTYFTGGKSYKRIGPTALVASLDDSDTANWVLVAGGGSGTPGTGTARDLGDVPTQKALDVIAAYQANGGPVEETDPLYFGQEFTDDFTEPGNEFEYRCRLRRVATGNPVRVWRWGRFLEAGV